MIILMDVEKVFQKTHYLVIIKTLNRLGIENYLDRTHLHKPKAGIIVKNERLNVPPLRLRISQWCLFLPLLLNIVLEVLAIVIRQEKKKQMPCRLDRKK